MLKIVLLLFHLYHWFVLFIIIGFPCFNLFYYTKILNNIVESLFCVSGVSAEHEDDLRVKMIVESEISLLLELYRYSSD